MIKLKNLVIRHKIALSFFAFIVIYNFVFVDKPFEFSSLCDVTYAYHLVDFSVGFCTKLLPGAIYNFFLIQQIRR